jgi:hypothetical protein
MKILSFPLAVLVCVATGSGCGDSDGRSDATVKTSDQLQDITNRSGGDWNKLTPQDKAFMLNLTHGSEASAKLMLSPPRRKR